MGDSHLLDGTPEHDLDGILIEGGHEVGHDADVGVRLVEVVDEQRVGGRHSLHHEPALASEAAMQDRIRPRPAAEAYGLRGHGPRQGPAAEHRAVLDDQGPVVEHEGDPAPQLIGDPPRGRMATPRDEDQMRPGGAGSGHGRAGARRDALAAREQRPVDVQGQEPEASQAPAQRPSQISTRSMTSPGRIFSTTSMPLVTVPNSA